MTGPLARIAAAAALLAPPPPSGPPPAGARSSAEVFAPGGDAAALAAARREIAGYNAALADYAATARDHVNQTADATRLAARHAADARDARAERDRLRLALAAAEAECRALGAEVEAGPPADPDLVPVRWRTRRPAPDGRVYEGSDPEALRRLLHP